MQKNPDQDEILELMQKQEDVIEHLELQLEYCRKEMDVMKEYCNQKDLEIAKLLEQLKSDSAPSHQPPPNIQTPEIESLVEQRLQIKDLEFQLEREKISAKSREIQYSMENETTKQRILELEEEVKTLKASQNLGFSKIETLTKQSSEWKAKFEALKNRSDEEIMRLESRLEISAQREAQLEEHSRQVLEEHALIRQEKVLATARISALIDETTTLRSKILQTSKNAIQKQQQNGELKDYQKLISDQSHLIAALREETKLLARKIEHDSQEYRQTLKTLKKEKKDVEERLKNLLKI